MSESKKGYGILRITKIKKSSWGEVRGRLIHMFREFFEEELKKAIEAGNQNAFAHSAEEALQRYRNRLNEITYEKPDAVGAMEIVVTLTADFLDTKSSHAYLRDSIKWVKKTFGTENIIAITFHNDEKVPHLHFMVVPAVQKEMKKKQTKAQKEAGIQETKKVLALDAKYWTGGKARMVKLQDDFYESVSKKYGFERGEPAEKTNRKNQRPQLNYEKKLLQEEKKDLEKRAMAIAVDLIKKENPDLAREWFNDLVLKVAKGSEEEYQKFLKTVYFYREKHLALQQEQSEKLKRKNKQTTDYSHER